MYRAHGVSRTARQELITAKVTKYWQLNDQQFCVSLSVLSFRGTAAAKKFCGSVTAVLLFTYILVSAPVSQKLFHAPFCCESLETSHDIFCARN